MVIKKLKYYQLTQVFPNGNLKPLAKYYSLTKAKLRKKIFEKMYPDKKYAIIIRRGVSY